MSDINQQLGIQPKENVMDTNTAENQTPQTEQPQVELNPEATQTKVETPATEEIKGAAEQGAETTEEKKEETEGVIKLISEIPKSVWQNGIKPTYEFVKNGVNRVWDAISDNYKAEVESFKEQGAVKYIMGRLGTIGFKLVKLTILAVGLIFLNNALVSYSGVTLFSPMALGLIFAVGVILVLGKSYMDQKDAGGEYSAVEAGTHVVDAFCNA